jgi:hypothetical protein
VQQISARRRAAPLRRCAALALPCDGDDNARLGATRDVEHVPALLGDEGAAVIEVLMLEEERKARAAFEAITLLEDKLGVLAGPAVEATIVLDAATGANLAHRLKMEGFLRGDQDAPEPLDAHAGLKIGLVSVYWPEA